jgi:hypothetical protein
MTRSQRAWRQRGLRRTPRAHCAVRTRMASTEACHVVVRTQEKAASRAFTLLLLVSKSYQRCTVPHADGGSKAGRASAFPSTTWERGKRAGSLFLLLPEDAAEFGDFVGGEAAFLHELDEERLGGSAEDALEEGAAFAMDALLAADGGGVVVDFAVGLVADGFLADEAAEHRADGLVLPGLAAGEALHDFEGGEGLAFGAPEDFHDEPLGLGDGGGFGHGGDVLHLYAMSQVRMYEMGGIISLAAR